MTRLNPRIDIAFKKIFGVEENKDLLISLINSIVSEEDQLEDLTLLNPYNTKNFYQDKLSILDIKAQGQNGKMYNIEMQITDEQDYDKRALYYWAKLYSQQLKESENYDQLNKAIGIHILNFVSIADNDKYHNCFHIVEKDTKQTYFNDLELHTIELKKFNTKEITEVTELVKKVNTALDMWVVFLTRNDLLNTTSLPTILNQPELNKALNVMDVMQLSNNERDEYEAHLKWFRAQVGAIKAAEVKGEARGELQNAIKIANKMLAKHRSIEEIIELTELSVEQIQELKMHNN